MSQIKLDRTNAVRVGQFSLQLEGQFWLQLYIQHRLKRNLSAGYQPKYTILNRVRGSIDLLGTERHQLLLRGKVACRFDEFTINTPRNRFVKGALEELAKIVQQDALATRCRGLAATLKRLGVTGECPSRSEVSVDRFGRHDIDDRAMVAAAHLAFNLALPTETLGSQYLPVPSRDIHWIRKLYEKGIAGFYEVVLSGQGWDVEAGKSMDWTIDAESVGIAKILPNMRTDIELNHRESKRRIIIDTKFNEIFTKGWYREETLRSGYIYQIYTYLRSQERPEDPLSATTEGILLHPAVGYMVNESVAIQGHEIRFATVDLGADAKTIRTQLLQVVAKRF